MQPEEIKAMIESSLDTEEVKVQGDGSHFELYIVSKQFEGLSTLKKQQLVYGVLNEKIADGSIHAVQMKTLTPQEKSQH
ncbi:MAG: BolA/IbaG family iron-sulfur metabolism protein [Pseudomonadales bacterium]|nr:BolA/IbaG family iron-sulfur metabolism protein [Pseudomonadales bacterium]